MSSIRHLPHLAMLWIALLLAVVAQAFIHFEHPAIGALAYLMSVVSLFVWAACQPSQKDTLAQQADLPPSTEKILLAVLFLLTLFTRFYDLGYRIYALESDESKWTAQSWYSVILGEEYGEFHAKHYIYLPVDFWVRSVFLRLFGVNYASPRIESAFISIVAVIFLYLLVRRLFASPTVALLSALLYGFSFGELTASHQALHSSPPELWLMPGLYFLVSAWQSKEKWRFQATGILMALGMLTYDTFLPTAGFALTWLTAQGMHEIIVSIQPCCLAHWFVGLKSRLSSWKSAGSRLRVRLSGLPRTEQAALAPLTRTAEQLQITKKKTSARNWLLYLALTAWPMALAYGFFTHEYLTERYFGYYYEHLPNPSSVSLVEGVARLLHGVEGVWTTTFSRLAPDQYLDWEGPLVNPLLLPWVAVGFAYTLLHIRRFWGPFLLALYTFQVLPATIMNYPHPRVLYTSLAPLMMWGALGLWVLYAALRSLQGSEALSRLALPVFVLVVGAILVNDYRIFTSALYIPKERIVRRELADFSTFSAQRTGMTLYPYLPNQHDPLELEANVILFTVSGAHGVGVDEARQHYRQLEASQLMLTLWQMRTLPGLDILFEKEAPTHQEDRLAFLQAVLTCYPQTELTRSGRYFDLYHVPAPALVQPRCHTVSPPHPLQPSSGARLPANQPVKFAWGMDDISGSSYEITLERLRPNLQWHEVENNFQGEGWFIDAKFAGGFYGAGFLLDSWQSKPANFNTSLAQAGQYHVWVRFYKRLDNDQQNFLEVAGRAVPFAQHGSPLNEWIWQEVGVFDLPSGPLPLSLFRVYGKDEQYSIFVDTLALTTDAAYNPNTDPPWLERIQSGEFSTASNEYTFSHLLLPGEYRWQVRMFDQNRLVDALGARGVASDFGWFTIVP